MSKRALTKYLNELSKDDLKAQIHELYDRLKEVKEFYKFVFNPKEEILVEEAKIKIGKEYFPPSGKKAKRRRSIAQKHIRNFIKLGVQPVLIADLMLYHIEIAQAYNAEFETKQDSFYKSMLVAFQETYQFIIANDLNDKFKNRLIKIAEQARLQNWINAGVFDDVLD